ncbi:MAG: hypothetical protein M3020_17060 [Myxococcota bacterium]|nr:hypothetical protein [Myxococcota bacterium]
MIDQVGPELLKIGAARQGHVDLSVSGLRTRSHVLAGIWDSASASA